MSLLSQSRATNAFQAQTANAVNVDANKSANTNANAKTNRFVASFAMLAFLTLGCDSSDLDKQSFASSSSTANAYANGFRPLSENDALLESIEL
ncbi:MAG: hypothetical protein LBO72_01795, partial [Helicobacteraceae bacterium]|nr:hypothetical protein [Helicobacteraceae bacterium]